MTQGDSDTDRHDPTQSLTDMQETAMRRMADMQAEGIAFIVRRLERDRTAMRHLAECRTLPEAWAVQMQAARDFTSDYAEGAAQTAAMLAGGPRGPSGARAACSRDAAASGNGTTPPGRTAGAEVRDGSEAA